MTQWTLVNNSHRWANSHNISCCCIIHQHNCPHPTTTTQKTEWSDPIITWDIRLHRPPLTILDHNCTYRPPTPFDCYPTRWHFQLLLFYCFGFVDTGTYLPPHKPNMTAALFVQFASQTNTHVNDQYAPHIHMHLTTTIPRHYYPPLTYTDPRCISFSSLTKVCCCIINTLDMSPTKPRASKSDELINKYAATYQLLIRFHSPHPSLILYSHV